MIFTADVEFFLFYKLVLVCIIDGMCSTFVKSKPVAGLRWLERDMHFSVFFLYFSRFRNIRRKSNNTRKILKQSDHRI